MLPVDIAMDGQLDPGGVGLYRYAFTMPHPHGTAWAWHSPAYMYARARDRALPAFAHPVRSPVAHVVRHC